MIQPRPDFDANDILALAKLVAKLQEQHERDVEQHAEDAAKLASLQEQVAALRQDKAEWQSERIKMMRTNGELGLEMGEQMRTIDRLEQQLATAEAAAGQMREALKKGVETLFLVNICASPKCEKCTKALIDLQYDVMEKALATDIGQQALAERERLLEEYRVLTSVGVYWALRFVDKNPSHFDFDSDQERDEFYEAYSILQRVRRECHEKQALGQKEEKDA